MTKPSTREFIIAADITTLTPLHISAIEKGTYNIDSRNILRYTTASGGIGCSLTRTMPLPSKFKIVGDTLSVPDIPVIPASTVAGKLRHACSDLLFKSFVARGLQITPKAYNTMTSGMASTELKADMATPRTNRAARHDPFLSNFGGTSFAMSAGTVIDEGWPLLALTTDNLMTPAIDDVLPISDLKQLTSAVAIVRKNDVADQSGAYLENVVGIMELAKYMEAESENRNDSKQRKGATFVAPEADATMDSKEAKKAVAAARKEFDAANKKSDLRALNAVEVVNPGVGFALRVRVTSRTPAHLGLMLLGMQAFLRDGQVGGKAARGFGRFICKDKSSRLYEVTPDSCKTEVMSSIFMGSSTGYAFADHPEINAAVVAAQDYIDSISPRLIEAFSSLNVAGIEQFLAESASA